jgi:hydroxymethylglutaryl-CoA lyase
MISNNRTLKILETPRDAMQGLHRLIPTHKKVELINALFKVGFDIVDIGSFVSPKAIPQMSDTGLVLDQIDLMRSRSKLFVLVVNTKGAVIASKYNQVSYIGFPFSSSPTFLKKNINSDFDKAWKSICSIQDICIKTNKEFMVYLSMAFGNPYDDPDNVELIFKWVEKLHKIGIKTISLSDIIGVATPEMVEQTYSVLTDQFSDIEFGIHLHIKEGDWYSKIDAAYRNGCKIFEGVINGLGGCPMTGYELLGNLPTGYILDYAKKNKIRVHAIPSKLRIARKISNDVLF